MGLKHNAFHVMLANPHLAPFELIYGPRQRQDWTLIDHLMVIHKVKANDYVEGNSQASIVNMARTLARAYIAEDLGTRCVVLVKDGARAQKPAVWEIRLKRPSVPHIDFCKRHMCAIEYTMMKLLADMGMKNKLFLVTGAKGDSSEHELLEGTSVGNLVSFHQKYLDYRTCWVDSVFPLVELPDLDPGYVDNSTGRPEGLEGVFVTTFADPKSADGAILRDLCLRCTSIEADTLLVELANSLTGNVTVCSGDSDVVAVLTACGREGVTMRMDNKSYYVERDMHTSLFGDLVFAIPENHDETTPFSELSSSEDRFRSMCDIGAEDDHLLRTARIQHDTFELLLDTRGKSNFKESLASYLYQCGVRGSVYCTFLSRFFELNAGHILDKLELAVDAGSVDAGSHIFEALYPASVERPLSSSDLVDYPCAGEKRKISCLHQEPEAPRGRGPKGLTNGLKRLSNAYTKGLVPRGSHGRFLRLTRAGRHIFLRIKGDVIRDDIARTEKLFFMALCGTDYNKVPTGLGIKSLLTGVVANYRTFASWCQELRSLLWGSGAPCQDRDYHHMGMKLDEFTNVPDKKRSTHWTEVNCGTMAKTLKYVCELWRRKRLLWIILHVGCEVQKIV
ncbi:hypothetical protein DPEC_G00366150 [Dallia pectoralis]|nr:hypothetical protein DPEC_G00366150 [Dallia pectoralis]